MAQRKRRSPLGIQNLFVTWVVFVVLVFWVSLAVAIPAAVVTLALMIWGTFAYNRGAFD